MKALYNENVAKKRKTEREQTDSGKSRVASLNVADEELTSDELIIHLSIMKLSFYNRRKGSDALAEAFSKEISAAPQRIPSVREYKSFVSIASELFTYLRGFIVGFAVFSMREFSSRWKM